MQGVPLLAASVGVQVLLSVADISAVIIIGWAVLRALVAPSVLFSMRWASKLLWALACFTLYTPIANVFVPVGALFVHWHITRLLRRKEAGKPEGVPFASGTDLTKRAAR